MTTYRIWYKGMYWTVEAKDLYEATRKVREMAND